MQRTTTLHTVEDVEQQFVELIRSRQIASLQTFFDRRWWDWPQNSVEEFKRRLMEGDDLLAPLETLNESDMTAALREVDSFLTALPNYPTAWGRWAALAKHNPSWERALDEVLKAKLTRSPPYTLEMFFHQYNDRYTERMLEHATQLSNGYTDVKLAIANGCVKRGAQESLERIMSSIKLTASRLVGIAGEAINSDQPVILRWLCEHYLDLRHPAFRQLARKAVEQASVEMLSILADAGLNMRFEADTLLIWYVSGRRWSKEPDKAEAVLEWLLAQGLDPQSQFGEALLIALSSGNLKLYQRLAQVRGGLPAERIKELGPMVVDNVSSPHGAMEVIRSFLSEFDDLDGMLRHALLNYRYAIANTLLELGANPKAQDHYLLRLAARSPGTQFWLASDVGRRIIQDYYTPDELRVLAADLLGSNDPADWLRLLNTKRDVQQSYHLLTSVIIAFPVEDLLKHLPNRQNSRILLNLAKLFGTIDLLLPHARSAKIRTDLALMMF